MPPSTRAEASSKMESGKWQTMECSDGLHVGVIKHVK